MTKTSLQRGFSLIELLVYTAILVIISTASVSYLLSLDSLLQQYRLETMLYRSSSNALEQIQVALRQADAFDALGSTLNDGTAGVLVVDIDGTETRVEKSADNLILSVGGVIYGTMVDDAVSVDSFTVYQYPTAIGDMVRVDLTLTATVDGTSKSVTVYTGSVIRGDL